KELLVGRESDSVGSDQLGCGQLHLAVLDAEDAAERQLLARIVVDARQPERWVGEVERAVRAVDEVVGAVEALALVAIGEHRERAGALQASDAAVAVLVDGEPPVAVERQAVGAGLVVLADVRAFVAALVAIYG